MLLCFDQISQSREVALAPAECSKSRVYIVAYTQVKFCLKQVLSELDFYQKHVMAIFYDFIELFRGQFILKLHKTKIATPVL